MLNQITFEMKQWYTTDMEAALICAAASRISIT